MRSLINYLDCGNITIRSNQNIVDFRVNRFSDILNKIIPFFKKYPILGVKGQDFADFTKVADLIKYKNHLHPEGLDQIRKIKAGMNKGRNIE
jgi:LAGLIDADG endonuclease